LTTTRRPSASVPPTTVQTRPPGSGSAPVSGGRCAGQPGTSTRAACPRMVECASRTGCTGQGRRTCWHRRGPREVRAWSRRSSGTARWRGACARSTGPVRPLGRRRVGRPRCARPSSCCCARSCRCTSRRARGGRCSTTTPTPRCSGRGTRTRWRRPSRTPGPRCGRVCSPCWRTRWPARRSSRRTCRCCWPAAAGRRRRGSPTR
jgi:hypothetical protein